MARTTPRTLSDTSPEGGPARTGHRESLRPTDDGQGADFAGDRARAGSAQAGGLMQTLQAEVVGVNVQGDRATTSIRFGGRGQISTVPVIEEGGKWKLAASPLGGK